MGQNRFAHVDILNVHDYEKRGANGQHEYVAYYEYFVAPEPAPKSDAHLSKVLGVNVPLPKLKEGEFWWVAKIHARQTGKVLAVEIGIEPAHDQARGAAQRWLQKAMEKHRRKP